jgi:lysophospholipase L1-like esterase
MMNRSLNRFLLWQLPLGASLVGVTLFGYGFYSGIRGDAGVAVGSANSAPVVRRPAATGTVRMILLGDSLARGIGDERGLGIGGSVEDALDRRKVKREETVNLAVSGARTRDLIGQLESRSVRTLIAEANVVVVSIGGNDLFGSAMAAREGPPENIESLLDEVRGRVAEIIGTVREANPDARIFLVGLYNPFSMTADGAALHPLVNRWNAGLVSEFEDDSKLTVVQTSDLFLSRDRLSADRFHPGAEAYEAIGRRIADSL